MFVCLRYCPLLLVIYRLQEAVFPLDSSYSVEPPAVNAQSKDIYETYVRRGLKGADVPSKRDMLTYNQYIYGKYS